MSRGFAVKKQRETSVDNLRTRSRLVELKMVEPNHFKSNSVRKLPKLENPRSGVLLNSSLQKFKFPVPEGY